MKLETKKIVLTNPVTRNRIDQYEGGKNILIKLNVQTLENK